MRHLSLAAVSALSLLGCFNQVEGGPEVSTTRALGAFTRLRVEGGLPVRFSPGPGVATITAPRRVEENLQTLLLDGTLLVRMKPGVFVDAFDTTEVTLSGPGVVTLEVVGASRLAATGLAAGQLFATAAGGSELTLSGAAVDLHLTAGGGAHLDASGLVADFVSIEASGGSALELHATKAVGGTASTGAEVRVSGPGDFSTVYATGGATVSAAAP